MARIIISNRPQSSTIGTLLESIAGGAQNYQRQKRLDEDREIQAEERKSRADLRRQQADNAKAQMDKYRIESAEGSIDDSIAQGMLQAQQQLTPERIAEATGPVDLSAGPPVELAGSDVATALEGIPTEATVPGSELLGVPEKTLSPTRMALQEVRAAQAEELIGQIRMQRQCRQRN